MENERDGFAINVAVVDDAIIVTMPGTRYSITYRKGPDPWLLASTPETSEEAAIRKWKKNAVTAVRLHWTSWDLPPLRGPNSASHLRVASF